MHDVPEPELSSGPLEPSVTVTIGWASAAGCAWAVLGEVLPASVHTTIAADLVSSATLWTLGVLGGTAAGAVGGLLVVVAGERKRARALWVGFCSAAVLGTALAATVRVEPYEQLASPWWCVALAAAGLIGLADQLSARARVVALVPAFAWAGIAMGAGTSSAPVAGAPPPGAPSVLLITVDGLRYDRMNGPSGDAPHLRELARGGVVWTQARSPSPEVAAAAASALFGVQPDEVALGEERGRVPEARGLAEQLRASGWRTGGFVSSRLLHRDRGFGQGFRTYDDDLRWLRGLANTSLGRLIAALRPPPVERRADVTTAFAQRWILAAHEPWFAWVHLHDPSDVYEPPPPYDYRYYDPGSAGAGARDLPAGIPDAQRRAIAGQEDVELVRARYRGEVALVDDAIGDLIDALRQAGRLENTIVVLAGTYGESLGDDEVWFRHDTLTEATLRVPLVVVAPGRLAPGRRTLPTSLAGLTPAVVDLALGRGALRGVFHDEPQVVRSVLRAEGDRPAQVMLRGQRVAYRLTDGAPPSAEAWTVSDAGLTPLELDAARSALLRADAEAVLVRLR